MSSLGSVIWGIAFEMRELLKKKPMILNHGKNYDRTQSVKIHINI